MEEMFESFEIDDLLDMIDESWEEPSWDEDAIALPESRSVFND